MSVKASQSSQVCATGQSNESVTGRKRFSMQHMISEGIVHDRNCSRQLCGISEQKKFKNSCFRDIYILVRKDR